MPWNNRIVYPQNFLVSALIILYQTIIIFSHLIKTFIINQSSKLMLFNLCLFSIKRKNTPRKPPFIRRKKDLACISTVPKREKTLLEEPSLPDVDFKVNNNNGDVLSANVIFSREKHRTSWDGDFSIRCIYYFLA